MGNASFSSLGLLIDITLSLECNKSWSHREGIHNQNMTITPRIPSALFQMAVVISFWTVPEFTDAHKTQTHTQSHVPNLRGKS